MPGWSPVRLPRTRCSWSIGIERRAASAEWEVLWKSGLPSASPKSATSGSGAPGSASVQATEVLSLKMRHVLETLGYRRLEWKCNALNAASRAAALRLGFRYEGIFLNHVIVKGRSRDTAWFSLTQEEWPAVREAHARWLAPDNFDAQGGQKCSLSDLTRALW